MNALLTVVIVIAAIWAMVVSALLLLARLKSHTSTPPSPTPSTTPTPTSDEAALKLMELMSKNFSDQMRETRQMVVDLTLGRPQTPTSTPETWPMQNERLLDFDYDSTPLSPGIEAVLEREEVETEQERILREREELQSRLIEKQAELDRANSETSLEESLPGPWSNGSDPSHARQD